MARKSRRKDVKKLIYVFCEGQSEVQYIESLKKFFSSVSVLIPVIGLIPDAEVRAKRDPAFKDNLSEVDELWFFFDVEDYDREKWSDWARIIKGFKKGAHKISSVRLLMTTGCVEYWFLLHYEKSKPLIQTKADKERVTNGLMTHVPGYKKADRRSIEEIAANYKKAIKNGEWTLQTLGKIDDIPDDDQMNRDEWLFKCGHTFTTVHEAIAYLEGLLKM